MAFDSSSDYRIIRDACGKVYYEQGGTVYNSNTLAESSVDCDEQPAHLPPSFQNTLPRPNTVIAVGDSLIAGGYVSSASEEKVTDRAWYGWMLAYLKQRLRLVSVHGQGGLNAPDLHDLVIQNVLSADPLPGYCIIETGGNDVLNSVDTDTVISNVKRIYRSLTNAGIVVIDSTIGASTSINTDALKYALHKFNHWKKSYAQQHPGVFVIDGHSVIVDGDSTSGSPASGMTHDGTHYSSTGAQRIGLLAYNLLDSVIPPQSQLISAYNDMGSLGEYGNLVTNPTFTGTSGSNSGTGASGSVANGWIHVVTGTITSVASKVARSGDNIGAWQRLAITGAGASATASMYQDISSNITVGDEYYGQIEIDASGFTTVASINLSIAFRDATTDLFISNTMTSNDGTINAHGNVVLKTLPHAAPTGTTNIYFTATITFDSGASAGAATVDFGRAEVRKFYDTGD